MLQDKLSGVSSLAVLVWPFIGQNVLTEDFEDLVIFLGRWRGHAFVLRLSSRDPVG